MALSHLLSAWGSGLDLSRWEEALGGLRVRNVVRLITTGRHSPPTSSAGRLFDAVSSMLGIRQQITFEGEAAMDLEMRSDPAAEGEYPFELMGEDPMVMDTAPLVRAIWKDLGEGGPVARIGGRFHRTLAAMVAAVCESLRAREGLDRVCLSGGVFQNVLLLRLTAEALERGGFQVHIHRQVPPNDGGISLGQAVVAGTRLGGGST
jgi:hydrogenase maturation protein HypF